MQLQVETSRKGIFVVYYADKELAEKFWGNGDIVPIDTENIEAKFVLM